VNVLRENLPVYPSDHVDLNDDTWRLIAVYDGMLGAVTEQRDGASGSVLAGPAGHRYVSPEPIGE